MAFGFLDTKFIDFAEGQTETRLKSLKNRLDISYEEFIRRVDGAMSALTVKDSLTAELTYDTTNDSVRGKGPTDKIWHRGAEYTPGRPQRGKGARGHLLPIYHYEIDMGMTDRSMKVIAIDQFEDEIRSMVQAIHRGRRADVLERLFSISEVPLDDDGTPSSPGFAGSGTGQNKFYGTTIKGQMTDADYSHYFVATQDAANAKAALDAAVENLQLWGDGYIDILPSQEMLDLIASWRADDEFVPTGSILIRPAVDESVALVGEDKYAGVYKRKIRVRHADTQIEGLNAALIRMDGTKPLAWRYDEIFGRHAYVEDRRLMPLTETAVMQVYGVGVSDRTSVALVSLTEDGTTYTPPLIRR